MSSATEAIPVEVLEALAIPALDGLSEEQVGGRACIWCASLLTIETAVQLGEHLTDAGASTAVTRMRTSPRGCRSCVEGRAHRGLFAHGSTCALCRDEQTAGECVVGRGLYRLVRETSRHVIFAIPCEPCTLARIFPRQTPKHECTGLAALSDGTVPCPCCRSTPPPPCARCRRPIKAGGEFDLPRYEQQLSASWNLSGRSLHTPRAARTHVTNTCQIWHVPRQAVEGLALITSELATNAVVHAHAEEVTVMLGLASHHVWVSVTDRGRPRSPVIRRTVAADAEDGRGLCLVEALATRWHATTSTSGTHVWACIALPRRGATRDQVAASAPLDDPANRVAPGHAEDPPHRQLLPSTSPTQRMP
ncbi:ATP-binding protein [Streptomyces sp. MAI_2237]